MTNRTKFQIFSEAVPEGIAFRLLHHRILGAPVAIPINEWAAKSAEAQLPGVARLLTWVDEDEAAAIDDTTVVVPHASVAALETANAQMLALPPTPPYLLDIQHVGTMDRPDFRFRVSWLQPNGQPMPGLRRVGASLISGGRTFRIPEPLFGIIEAIDDFNVARHEDLDGRFRAWARMRDLLPEESQRSIKVDGYLTSTRIAHAASPHYATQAGGCSLTN